MIESFFRMKSTAKQEKLHPQNVCGSLSRGVHNNTASQNTNDYMF